MPKKKDLVSQTASSQSMDQSLTNLIQSLKNILKNEDEVFGTTKWYLHTGNYSLDYIISGKIKNGGYPAGKIIEIYGPKSTGKTLLLILAVREMQKLGGVTIVADVEYRWNKDFATLHGVNWDLVVGWHPITVEDFTIALIDALESLPDDGKVLICLDSLAALSTYKEVEEKGIKSDQGRKAQRIRATMRILPSILNKKGAILLVANHVIDMPGVVYGPTYTTPGGKGVAFHSTVRLETTKMTPVKIPNKSRPVGTTMDIVCTKNSETAPFGSCQITMSWTSGVNPYSGLLDIATDLGIIEYNGGWYTWKDKKYRAKELLELIENNDEFFNDPRWEKPYFLSLEEDKDVATV